MTADAAALPGKRTIAVAHRGDPAAHLENTLPAFRAAVAGGAHMVELDCQLTSDGRVVVLGRSGTTPASNRSTSPPGC